MNFARNLMGGLVIMAVATVIGIAQNAARGNPIPLIARLAKPAVSSTPITADDPAGGTPAPIAPEPSDVAVDPSPTVTNEELLAGELSMARLKIVLEAGTAFLIDARGETAFAEGHIPGAYNIPTDEVHEHDVYGLVSTNETIIVYCTSVTCDLGERLAQELRLMQYPNVVVYRGGWEEWSEAGNPSEQE